jgi:hypothetical protein
VKRVPVPRSLTFQPLKAEREPLFETVAISQYTTTSFRIKSNGKIRQMLLRVFIETGGELMTKFLRDVDRLRFVPAPVGTGRRILFSYVLDVGLSFRGVSPRGHGPLLQNFLDPVQQGLETGGIPDIEVLAGGMGTVTVGKNNDKPSAASFGVEMGEERFEA